MSARARPAAAGAAAASTRPSVQAPPTFAAAVRDRALTVNAGRRRRDPTRTAGLRRRFEEELARRFRELERRVVREVEELDGFNLEPEGLGAIKSDPIRSNTIANRARFDFPRSADKVAAFKRWLRDAARKEILNVTEGVPLESAARSAWSNLYIETAYQKGIAEAGAKLRAAGADVGQSWVSSAFNRPVHADRVGLIYTRVFEELDGITDRMASAMSKVLAEGLAEGRSPRDIARRLAGRVRSIGRTRALTIARTEVIAAHADATLNAYVEAGIDGVEVEAEWSTTGDERVCRLCEELEGRVFRLDEARNMLPRHPNCRCAWRPKIVGARGVVLNWRYAHASVDTVRAASKRRRGASRNVPRANAHDCPRRDGRRGRA